MKPRMRGSVRRRTRPILRVVALGMALTVAASGTTVAAASPGVIRVRNLMPDFWNFWRAAQREPSGVKLGIWRRLYRNPNAAVFADLKTTCGKDLRPRALETQYFPVLKSVIPGMRALSARLPKLIASVEARFIRAFPDMRWRGPIYIMASAGCFNGRSQLIHGRQALLLGVDDIVALHETNLAPLITHEMFHRYHYFHFAFEPELPQPLWVRVWAEGMATFVAHRLNPSASVYDLTWIRPGEIASINAHIASITRRFVRRLNSSSRTDATDYFSSNGRNTRIPPRVGYYLGLKVAEYLAHRYSMRTMARWNHAQAKPRILMALRHLERSRAGRAARRKLRLTGTAAGLKSRS